MSSAMKDARWQIATERAGGDWDAMAYRDKQLRLDAAQEQLNAMATDAIQALADKWNEN